MKKWGVVLLGVFIAGSAFAGLAPFNGQPGTTYQSWGFGTDAVVSSPDSDPALNPYGGPTATVVGVDPPLSPPDFIPPDTYWKDSDNGHQGVWRLYGDSSMQLYIPNNPVENDQKRIWFRMIYYASGYTGAEPEFFTFPENMSVELIEKVEIDEHFYYEGTWEIIIEPNPVEEWIVLQPRDCTVYIDEIIVETICEVPEPATMVLLGLGGLLLRKRK